MGRGFRVSVNWSAEAMVWRLILISMSISNVVASLKFDLTGGEGDVVLSRPEDPDVFEQAFNAGIGVKSTDMDTVVGLNLATEAEWTKERLLSLLEQRSPGATTQG